MASESKRDKSAFQLLAAETADDARGVAIGADDLRLEVPVGAADHDLDLAAADGNLRLGGHGVRAGVHQPVALETAVTVPSFFMPTRALMRDAGRRVKIANVLLWSEPASPVAGGPAEERRVGLHRPGHQFGPETPAAGAA